MSSINRVNIEVLCGTVSHTKTKHQTIAKYLPQISTDFQNSVTVKPSTKCAVRR